MKVNLSLPVLDLEGKPIKDGDKDLTVRTVCCGALLTPDQKNPDQTSEEKVKFFKLALRIADDEEDFSIDDIAILKKQIGKLFPPLVVGRCFEVLDPEPKAVRESA